MKRLIVAFIIIVGFMSTSVMARDDINNYNIQNALSSPHAVTKLGEEIQFFFGDQKHGKVNQDFGVFKTNKKTNALNKSDQDACEWVFLTAMIALKQRAISKGANAVVDIKSNYKNNLTSSEETFQCGAGTFVAGVALTGKMVKL